MAAQILTKYHQLGNWVISDVVNVVLGKDSLACRDGNETSHPGEDYQLPDTDNVDEVLLFIILQTRNY